MEGTGGLRPAFALLLIMIVATFSSLALYLRASDLDLKTSNVSIGVDTTNTGVIGLSYIKNSEADSIAFASSIPMWSISVLDTSSDSLTTNDLYDIRCDYGTANCDSFTHSFRYDYPASGDSTLEISWIGVTHDSFPSETFNITAQLRVYSGDKDVSFNIDVENVGDSLALFNVDYPYYWIQENETDKDQVLGQPYRAHGNTIRKPISVLANTVKDQLNQNVGNARRVGFDSQWWRNAGHNPGTMPLQFFAFYDEGSDSSTGLYAATTDTLGYFKAFHVSGYPDSTALELFTRHFPEDNDANFGDTYSMPYEYRMRPFHGDWIDASKIYRDWLIDSPLVKDAGGTLQFRDDFQTVVNKAHYGFVFSPDDTTMEEHLDFFYSGDSDSLRAMGRIDFWGHPTPYKYIFDYACVWESTTTDTVYPPDYVDAVKNMHGTMAAYLNLSSSPWAVYDYSYCDFDSVCAPDSVDTRVNTAIVNINQDTLTTGNPEVDCRVEYCTRDTAWAIKYMKATEFTLQDTLGANAIYGDTRGGPILCYGGASHGHPNGGGYYYLDGRRLYFEATDSAFADGDSLITANEGPMDVKIGWRDYFISEAKYESRKGLTGFQEVLFTSGKILAVPIVESVLHDNQAMTFGLTRHTYSDATNSGYYRDQHFEYGIASEFIDGSMIAFRQDTLLMADTTWSDDQDSAYVYLRDMMKIRRDFAPYLISGEWRRPPGLACSDSTIVNFFGNTPSLPSLLSSAFIRVDSLGAAEDSLSLFFTNYSDSSASCITSFDLDDYGFSPGDTTLDFMISEYIYDDGDIDTTSIDTLALSNSVTDTLATLGRGGTAIIEYILLPR